jgi:hypothetical protein
MKEYDALGGYRCSATGAPLVDNPVFPESTATFFFGGWPYEVECFEPVTENGGCGWKNQKLECPAPFLVSDRSGCETCKMPCPSFLYETSEYRTMWAVRLSNSGFLSLSNTLFSSLSFAAVSNERYHMLFSKALYFSRPRLSSVSCLYRCIVLQTTTREKTTDAHPDVFVGLSSLRGT